MQSEVYTNKQIKLDTQDELPARILQSAARTKKREDQQHAIFAHELQSALSVTLGL